MGSFCSACNKEDGKPNEDIEPRSNQRNKGEKYRQTADASDDEIISDPDTDDTGYENSLSESIEKSETLTEKEIEVAYDGWKKAVDSGNETLATFNFEEYPSVDMFQYKWPDGDSALMTAVRKQKPKLALFLITVGASVNEQNAFNGNTAIHYAVEVRNEKLIQLLLKWNADPDVMNTKKESPKTMASDYHDKDIINMLCGTNNRNLNSNEPSYYKTISTADAFADITAEMHDVENDIDDIFNDNADGGGGGSNQRGSESQSVSVSKKYDDDPPPPASSKPVKKYSEADSKRLLDTVRAAKMNPFGKLGRRPTAQVKNEIKGHLNQQPLPKLEAWLEKRKPGGGLNKKSYQKRWCIVKGAHLLWSTKQRVITNDADRKERKKFNGAIHLMTIESIGAVETNSNNKFMVKAKCQKKGAMREYIFRAQNKKERDFWLHGLKEHKKQYQQVLHYLGK